MSLRLGGPAARCLATLSLLLSIGSCGEDAAGQLSAVADNVDRIESGVLDMRLSVSAVSAPEARIGFGIHGPFALEGSGLEADLTYRQVAGSEEAEVRFVAVDGRAFVESDGTFFELPVEDDPSTAEAPTALQDLGFEGWAADPTVVGGDPGDHLTITSPLDEVSALAGIGRLLDDLEMKEASGLAVLEGLDDEALERSVSSGSITVRIGPDDLLRELIVRMRFGVDPSSPLAEILQGVTGAELLFTVEIAEANRPVSVELPQGARPISELPGS
jgi:hypothetical protein